MKKILVFSMAYELERRVCFKQRESEKQKQSAILFTFDFDDENLYSLKLSQGVSSSFLSHGRILQDTSGSEHSYF